MIISLMLLALQAAAPQPAEKKPWRDFEFKVGGYLAAVDTTIDVVGENGVGADFDLEDLLGLDTSVFSVRIEASVAMAQRHRLHFNFFDLSRTAEKTLGRDVEFDGSVYPIGTDVSSRMSLQMFDLTYGYSFVQDSRVDMAVTFGIHGMRTALKLDASSAGIEEEERFFLPIPLPGLRMDIAITPSVWLRQRIELLWIGTETFSGLMTDFAIGVEWAAFDHLAIGLGFNSVHMKLKMENNDFPAVTFRGDFDFQFSGLQFYVNVFF